MGRTPSLGESIFIMEYNLCQEYSLDPITIDYLPFLTFMELYCNTRRVQIDLEEMEENDKKQLIPATTNDW